MPELCVSGAACLSDGALLLDRFGTNASGARGQRAERQLAPHAILAQRIARRRLRLLFGGDVASRQQGKQRIEELPEQPAVDDLPLTARRVQLVNGDAPPTAG
jgi:hypothetical protein